MYIYLYNLKTLRVMIMAADISGCEIKDYLSVYSKSYGRTKPAFCCLRDQVQDQYSPPVIF